MSNGFFGVSSVGIFRLIVDKFCDFDHKHDILYKNINKEDQCNHGNNFVITEKGIPELNSSNKKSDLIIGISITHPKDV